jgi:acyl carrier protein
MLTWTPAELIDILQKAFAGFLGIDPADVDPNQSIRDLGMDSLTAMELAIDVEERLGVSMYLDDFTGRETIAQLAAAFVQERAP